MAMYDWNGNGKKDMGDNYMEYQIYKDSTSKNSAPRRSTNSSGMSFLIAVVIALLAEAFCGGLGVLIMLGYGLLKFLGM